MKKLIFAVLLFSSFAVAQGVRYDIPPILSPRGTPLANVQVSLCSGTATITGSTCNTPTQSFTDITLVTQCSIGSPVTLANSPNCQGTSDGAGNAGFWLSPGAYIYCLNGPQITGQCYNLTAPVGVTSTGTGTFSGAVTAGKINNRIYVDGTKYPLTQAGIQQALTDACAIGSSTFLGTSVYLPPMSATFATGLVETCPLKIMGAGNNQTLINVSSGPALTIKPNANYSANQNWEVAGLFLNGIASDAIKLDDTLGFGIVRPYIHDNVLVSVAASFAINTTGTTANASFDGVVSNNYLFGGINLHGTNVVGDADGWIIENNTFDSSLTNNTTAAINMNCVNGAAQYTVFHNRGSWAGAGIVVSTGCSQPKILYNQFELAGGTGSTNGAMVDLQGTTYSISGAEIRGNNLNSQNFSAIVIRLGTTSDAVIESNVISVKASTGVGITITANASNTSLRKNVFLGTGGGATAISDSGTGTLNNVNFQKFTSNGTFTIPSGITAVKATVCAPGGGGGGSTAANTGGGGGAGGCGIKWLTALTPGLTITVTVPAGGAGGVNVAGTAGGNSTLTSGTQTITTVTCFGGGGGNSGAIPVAGTNPTAVCTNADINGAGAGSLQVQNAGGFSGKGADCQFGGGGGNSGTAGVSSAAVGFCAGGGGAQTGANGTGGAGAGGIVIFEWSN